MSKLYHKRNRKYKQLMHAWSKQAISNPFTCKIEILDHAYFSETLRVIKPLNLHLRPDI